MGKVLVIPSSEYNQIFNKLCVIGKQNMGWEIFCIAPKYYLKYYKDFINSKKQLHQFPDLLEKTSWESDPKERNEIKALISAAEAKLGIPINRILLSCEKDIGRAYSKSTYFLAENKTARYILKNSEFGETLLLRSFKFVSDILKEVKPDLCLGAPPAGILRLTLYYLTHYYDIPFGYAMFSMSLPNRHYWSRGWGGFNDCVELVFNKLKKEDRQPSKESLSYIDNFRNRPEPMPIYLSLWRVSENSGSFLNINKLIFQRFLHRVIPIIKRIKVSDPKPFIQYVFDVYRTAFLKIRQKHLYKRYSTSDLKKIKYIYYPCHQEPEFVLNLRASDWYDQLITIKKLSYNLPYGYKLLVREHRHNIGRKKTSHLKEILKYPGVVLIDGYDDQYKYINNADLIVTVNGTSGWEGILLNKKVLTLDKTNYDPIVNNSYYKNRSSFDSAIMEALSNNKISEKSDIALFLDAEKLVSFSDNETSINEIHHILKILEISNQSQSISEEFSPC